MAICSKDGLASTTSLAFAAAPELCGWPARSGVCFAAPVGAATGCFPQSFGASAESLPHALAAVEELRMSGKSAADGCLPRSRGSSEDARMLTEVSTCRCPAVSPSLSSPESDTKPRLKDWSNRRCRWPGWSSSESLSMRGRVTWCSTHSAKIPAALKERRIS